MRQNRLVITSMARSPQLTCGQKLLRYKTLICPPDITFFDEKWDLFQLLLSMFRIDIQKLTIYGFRYAYPS